MVGYRIGHEGLLGAHSETSLIWRQQHIEITEPAVSSVPLCKALHKEEHF